MNKYGKILVGMLIVMWGVIVRALFVLADYWLISAVCVIAAMVTIWILADPRTWEKTRV